ncbi:SsgA family sporulation/cell division regulator [Streptomyces sp. NBC_01431]|uniref:SsgA family sporulation/cell division regulator n=1 Tax=Streptomyces sp. NBC_01431 TaxID=2903863 RepID=UPI002E36164D|nr:SsgA family sporulation/cell division regulator [Streptomyces sp. NBC_01431]
MSFVCDTLFMEMELELDSGAAQQVPVTARLTYDATDAFAITVDFELHAGMSVTWRLARDLLAQGIEHPVGEGDVRAAPQLLGPRREVRIELMGAGLDGQWGRAVFSVSARALQQFLERTYEAVPAGEEEADVDGFLAELFTRD